VRDVSSRQICDLAFCIHIYSNIVTISLQGCLLNDSADRTLECWPRIPTWQSISEGMPDFGGSTGIRMESRFPVIGESTGNYGENYAFNRLREINQCRLHQYLLAKRELSGLIQHSETCIDGPWNL
jgi:hypothetical protein